MLCRIELIYEVSSEYNHSLNMLHEELSINKSNQEDYSNSQNIFILVILYRIEIIYHCIEDTNEALDTFKGNKNAYFRLFKFYTSETIPEAARTI